MTLFVDALTTPTMRSHIDGGTEPIKERPIESKEIPDNDDDETSFYSHASTLTSMPSLAVIPKGSLARYAPAQFHCFQRGDRKQKTNSDPRNPPRAPCGKENVVDRRVVPPRARRSPIVRPTVAIRRTLQRPTIGNTSTDTNVNNINTPSWWEMPLDSLLGYPSLPSSTQVWDPLYEYDDEDDWTAIPVTKEEGSI